MIFLRMQFQTDRTSGLAVRKVNLQLLGTGRAYVFFRYLANASFFLKAVFCVVSVVTRATRPVSFKKIN